jgi:tRNA(fMet)-specific endonuclease VapC
VEVRVALDSNTYTDLNRGVDRTVVLLEAADAIVLPFVVIAELRAGFAHGRRRILNEAILRRFLMKPRVSVAYPDDDTTFHYAGIYVQLRHQGTPIPIRDMWIAAIVLQHNLALHARDAHFDHLPQVVRA